MARKGTLEKMTVVAFSDPDLTKEKKKFVVMYNPNTFTVSNSNTYDEKSMPTTGTTDQKAIKRNPRKLTVDFFFDGTGASPSPGSSNVVGASTVNAGNFEGEALVDRNVNDFLDMAYQIDGNNHRPAFLVFVWGKFLMPGVLESANVTYSLFDVNGLALRAKVSLSVKEHVTDKKAKLQLRLSSPDLSHSRTIIAGDKLPNLAQEIYGDQKLYVALAKANNLTNYRKLEPGQQLFFPPIEKLTQL